MICIYPADATDFSSNGLCVLTPTACSVTETLNGEWELTMTHPLDVYDKWTYLQTGCILRVPVPAAMTPRVNMKATSGVGGTQIYKIDTSKGETPYGTLRLRSKASDTASVLATYKNTSEVIVLDKSNASWYEVTAPDGKHGFMASKYLVFVRSEGQSSSTAAQFVESRQLRDQPFRIYRVVPTCKEAAFDTTALKQEKAQVKADLLLSSDQVARMIQANAALALNQEEYTKQFNAVCKRYDDLNTRLTELEQAIADKESHRAEMESFMLTLMKQPDMVTAFDSTVYHVLVERMMIGTDGHVVVRFRNGIDIDVLIDTEEYK